MVCTTACAHSARNHGDDDNLAPPAPNSQSIDGAQAVVRGGILERSGALFRACLFGTNSVHRQIR